MRPHRAEHRSGGIKACMAWSDLVERNERLERHRHPPADTVNAKRALRFALALEMILSSTIPTCLTTCLPEGGSARVCGKKVLLQPSKL